MNTISQFTDRRKEPNAPAAGLPSALRPKIRGLWTLAVAWLSAATVHPQPTTNAEGFRYASPETQLQFPEDHGSHPDFKTEWWYLTGHLGAVKDDRRLGFQVTFFRSASKSNPDAEADQFYLAHAAITDKESGAFLHEERLNTAHWNADAAVGKLDLFNGNWYLRMTDPNTEKMAVRFSLKEVGVLNLTLTPLKPKTLFGDEGYSKKGDVPGAASHYITFTRLGVSGTLSPPAGEEVLLSGLAWMDHEFSSSQLTEEQIGWNWTSLILNDGSELMAYVMRRKDGLVDPNSRLTLIGPDGEKTELSGNAFSWTPVRYWTSPYSEARYPVAYEVAWTLDGEKRTVTVKPFVDNQELVGSIGDFVYWEGASQAFDEDGQAIGLGYTELTGYDDSLYGKF